MLSLDFSLIPATISLLIIRASPLILIICASHLFLPSLPRVSPSQTLFSSCLLTCVLCTIILNLLTCLPQVLCSACYGSDRQLRDSTLGPGEDRQWHSARHPPLCSHCVSCPYPTHTHAHTDDHADPCTFTLFTLFKSHYCHFPSYIIHHPGVITASC